MGSEENEKCQVIPWPRFKLGTSQMQNTVLAASDLLVSLLFNFEDAVSMLLPKRL
jgi:hypothetical protein